MKKFFIVLSAAFLIFAVFAACVWIKIGSYEVFESPQDAPEIECALVLGSIKYLKNGGVNLYYKSRIETAAQLYRLGKVKKIIASGDNSRKDYDEPTQMKADLVALGVKEEDVLLDYAGFRTLDSIRRARNVFKCGRVLIVSQKWHCKRALYLCDSAGMKGCAACEAKVDVKYSCALRNRSREILAWLKAWIDINLLGKKARFEN